MTKHHKCPHCGAVNAVDEPSWDEALSQKLPESLLKATLITLAGIPTGGLGSLVVGGIFYGDSVVKFVNGTKVACGKCGNEFRI